MYLARCRPDRCCRPATACPSAISTCWACSPATTPVQVNGNRRTSSRRHGRTAVGAEPSATTGALTTLISGQYQVFFLRPQRAVAPPPARQLAHCACCTTTAGAYSTSSRDPTGFPSLSSPRSPSRHGAPRKTMASVSAGHQRRRAHPPAAGILCRWRPHAARSRNGYGDRHGDLYTLQNGSGGTAPGLN